MAITIKDVAQKAGVSNAMVSRALTGSGPVAPDKKQKILEIANIMGYTPNQAAVSLRKSKTRTIGLFFSFINRTTSPYVIHQVLIGIYDIIQNRYNVMVKGIDMHNPGSLNPGFYDGLLVMSQQDSDIEFLEEAWAKKIPMIALSRQLPLDIPFVVTDEAGGMAKAMEYLLSQGHRRIGIIEGPQNLEATLFRHGGWWTAAKRWGLEPQSLPMESGNFRYRTGKTAAIKLLSAHPDLTALLCFNDEMALGAIDAAAELGLKTPEDLSVTGYDNWDFAGHSDARLTTVERNTIQIASEGTRMLLGYLEQGIRPKNVYLENKLIIRESVRNLSNS